MPQKRYLQKMKICDNKTNYHKYNMELCKNNFAS